MLNVYLHAVFLIPTLFLAKQDHDHEKSVEGDRSEKDSSLSAGGKVYFYCYEYLFKWLILHPIEATSANDDMRQLKDFKALISEKTVPKSIKILKRTVLVLVAILIILTCKKSVFPKRFIACPYNTSKPCSNS